MESTNGNSNFASSVPEARSTPVLGASARHPVPQAHRSATVIYEPHSRGYYVPGIPSCIAKNLSRPPPQSAIFNLVPSVPAAPRHPYGNKIAATGMAWSSVIPNPPLPPRFVPGVLSTGVPSTSVAQGTSQPTGRPSGTNLVQGGGPPAGQAMSNTNMSISQGGQPRGASASGSNASMAPAGSPPASASSSNASMSYDKVPNRENVIALWVSDIGDPTKKAHALKKLSCAAFQNDDLPIAEWLWHSFGVVTVLLGDITSRFPVIMSPEKLTDEDAVAIGHALDMFTVLVRSPTTRQKFLDCQFAAYFIPLLKLSYGVAPSRDSVIQKVLTILCIVLQTMGMQGTNYVCDLGTWAPVYRLYFETPVTSPAHVAAKTILDRLSNVLGVSGQKQPGEWPAPGAGPNQMNVSYGGPNPYAVSGAKMNTPTTTPSTENAGKPKAESNTRTAA